MTTATNLPTNFNSLFDHIHERYADDASFLWGLRSIAVNRPNYTAQDISELDNRIDSLTDGLMCTPEESWLVCDAALAIQQAGEVFAASVLAFRSLDVFKIQRVVEVGLSDNHACKGLISAMAWLPGRLVHSWIKKFLTSKDLNHKYLALAVCGARRENPREFLEVILQREDCIAHQKLHTRALRLIGELKRFDLAHVLNVAMLSDDADTVFWANWSTILLGDKSAAMNLQEVVLKNNNHQLRAIELVFRVLPLDVARTWISLLAQDPVNSRLVIQATANLGDPQAVNWLIAQMRLPAMSRIAGEAFTTITGIDLQTNKLALEELPDLNNLLPEASEDEGVELNDDEYLVFPDVNKVAAIWQKYQHRFISGQRYFMGQVLSLSSETSERLRQIYATANQRQRRMAALELALVEPSQFLLNYAEKGINE